MREPGYESLRALLSAMPFYAALCDRELGFVWANRFDPTLERDDVIGKSPRDFVAPEDAPTVVGAMERAFATGETQRYELKAFGFGAWETWYDTWVIPFEDRGEPLLFMLTAESTERKRAERQLSLALDAGNVGLWEWDLDTGELSLGVTIARLLGVASGEVPATRGEWEARLHPEDRALVHQAFRAHCEERSEAFQAECRLVDAHGEVVGWVLERGCVSRYDAGGAPLRAIGTHVDVTAERREIERREELTEQLRQAQKMETIGQLAGGVAHDFNNLLMVIRGQLEFAREAVERRESPLEELDDIAVAAARASELTKQLLSFSRREALRTRVVELGRLVEEATRMLRRTLPASVRLEVDRRADGRVRADPRQIEQVLLNLCINAADAMEGSGTVTLRVDRAAIEADDPRCDALGRHPGDYLVLSVIDDGEGMDAETRAQVFEPFFTTKHTGKGTGLGLAVVHGIVEQHGGFVEVDSSRGDGTTFAVHLTEWRDDDDERPGARPTLLVAEDDPAVRRILVKILHYAGYRVLEAEDGEIALEVFAEHGEDIDLVVLDVVMPRRGGFAVYDALRADHPTLPVLFCSGYSDEQRTLDDDHARRLAKPVDRATILGAVDELMRT